MRVSVSVQELIARATRACLRVVAGEEVCSADGEWKASEERDACGGDASVQVCTAESSSEEHAGHAE